jgi:hypothetical protein
MNNPSQRLIFTVLAVAVVSSVAHACTTPEASPQPTLAASPVHSSIAGLGQTSIPGNRVASAAGTAVTKLQMEVREHQIELERRARRRSWAEFDRRRATAVAPGSELSDWSTALRSYASYYTGHVNPHNVPGLAGLVVDAAIPESHDGCLFVMSDDWHRLVHPDPIRSLNILTETCRQFVGESGGNIVGAEPAELSVKLVDASGEELAASTVAPVE